MEESDRPYIAAENEWFRMIRTPRYKYCRFAIADRGESLIHLENDPGEMCNLAEKPEYRKVLDEHRKLLAEWYEISGDDDAKFSRQRS